MNIQITQTIKSDETWENKRMSVILVKEPYHIDIVFLCLREQDDYWEEGNKDIIQVMPQGGFKSLDDLNRLCIYCFKCDIYKVPEFVEKMNRMGIEIFIYQQPKEIE